MAATLSGIPNRFSGVSATNACILVPLPSSGSHIGVRMAAGWIELQRISHPCWAQ
jgi:hypothetical protein